MDSYQDDPAYEEFVSELASHCFCCQECSSIPCDGVLAGGLCDNLCSCDDEHEESYIDDGDLH